MMRLEPDLSELQILVVDDEPVNLLLVRRLLERAGYTCVQTTTDPSRVPELFAETRPDLVVLDLHMPGMDGFELMDRLTALAGGRGEVPFLVLTADVTEDTKRRALARGARDFLTKPFSHVELLLRVRNLLEVHQLHVRLREQNSSLEHRVAERTHELEQARLEILSRLALAAEYRDDATQQHASRIGRTCGLLAAEIGLADWQAELIRRAAPLHDIGKIGIPDAILLKPGKLTDVEFAAIKTHTTIGAKILSGSQSSVLLLAEGIALSHHERWDGGGYPRRLRGEEIPLAARIVTVADVFDVLTHERPYKHAWPLEEAVDEIVGQRGRQFDPGLVDVFATLDHRTLLDRVNDSDPHLRGSVRRSEVTLAGIA
jgi:putative two-component system response regulator